VGEKIIHQEEKFGNNPSNPWITNLIKNQKATCSIGCFLILAGRRRGKFIPVPLEGYSMFGSIESSGKV
jgi:hypothetical protein